MFTFVVMKDYDPDYRRLVEHGKRVDFDPTLPYAVATFKDEAEARWYAGFKSADWSRGCLRYFVTENAEARA